MNAVRIWEEPLEMKTYLAGPPDPNPVLAEPRRGHVYPFAMLDDLTCRAVRRTYRAVVLENEYLRVTVLPELGGHVHSVYDKLTASEVFYRNHVVKPGLVALRGAWISGGIEFNFPIGHSTTTVTPIDHVCQAGADGSATCWVGNLERVGRMKWLVGVRLRPGRSFLETDIRLWNRTDRFEPYYFWSNAAVPAADDLQVIFPARQVLTAYGLTDYPIRRDGVDITWYRNHVHPDDIFAAGSLEDFFGCYWHSRDRGLVHWNDHRQAVGKKFFTWGTSHDGRIWDVLLTDDDGPYVELQSGRFANQGLWEFLAPHGFDGWLDYWYPVHGIGRWDWATREAAVHLAVEEGAADLGVAVTGRQAGALVELHSAGRTVWRETADLAPERPLRRRVPVTWNPADTAVRVVEAAGRELVTYRLGQPVRYDPGALASDPRRQPADTAAMSAADLMAQADLQQRFRQWSRARTLVEQALSREPDHAGARVVLAELEQRRGRPEQAVALFEQADPAAIGSRAGYLWALALRRLGRTAEAVRRWQSLAETPDVGPASLFALAELALAAGRPGRAARLLQGLLQRQARDTRAAATLAAVCRRLGWNRQAARWRQYALALDPTDALAAMERALAEDTTAAWQELAGRRLAAGSPFVEIASDYMAAGMLAEAGRALECGLAQEPAADEIVTEEPSRGPDALLLYWLAYVRHLQGEEEAAAAALARARQQSPIGTFPSRIEELDVFAFALQRQPDDAHAHLHLGTLLYALDRAEEAVAHWRQAAQLDPRLAVAHRNLGFDAWRRLNRLEEAARHYEAALQANPQDYRYWRDRDAIGRALREPLEERLGRLESAPASARAQQEVVGREIALQSALGRFDEAVALLDRHSFRPWEGGVAMRRLYAEALLGRGRQRLAAGDLEGARHDFARALEYPDRIGVGRPHRKRRRDAKGHYLLGAVLNRLGQTPDALEQFRLAAAETHEAASEGRYWQLLARRALGEDTRADEREFFQAVEKAAADRPDEADTWFLRGLAGRLQEDRDRADAAFRRVLELDPEHVESRLQRSLG